MIILLVSLVAIFVVGGQVLLKLGLNSTNEAGEASHFIQTLWVLLRVPYFWGAVFCLGLSGFTWLYVIRHYELSLAYPLTSISYILMLFAGFYFLGERITLAKILGTGVIVIGILIITLSNQIEATG